MVAEAYRPVLILAADETMLTLLNTGRFPFAKVNEK